MPRPPAHSEKGLTTLALMGCAPDATWRVPDIVWERVRRPRPTAVPCETCQGRGRVTAPPPADAPPGTRGTLLRCPTCPRSRRAAGYGTGRVTRLVEREVEEGRIVWPEGTRFDSRYHRGSRCGLCNKPVRSHVPVAGQDAAGGWHGLYVGEDCAATILRIASAGGVALDAAWDAAAAAKAGRAAQDALRAVREITTPKPAPAPKPAALADRTPGGAPAPKADLDALVHAAFGAAVLGTDYEQSRSQLRYTELLEQTPGGERDHFELVVTARHGVTVRRPYLKEAPLLKDPARFDAAGALAEAIPALRARLFTPKVYA